MNKHTHQWNFNILDQGSISTFEMALWVVVMFGGMGQARLMLWPWNFSLVPLAVIDMAWSNEQHIIAVETYFSPNKCIFAVQRALWTRYRNPPRKSFPDFTENFDACGSVELGLRGLSELQKTLIVSIFSHTSRVKWLNINPSYTELQSCVLKIRDITWMMCCLKQRRLLQLFSFTLLIAQ